MHVLKIGTRPSRLALKQVREISKALPSIFFKVVEISTKGDRDKTTPLSQLEGTDFFTREIEEALIHGWIDAAVHSAKDIESIAPEELALAATTASVSPYDCLVSKNGLSLRSLSSGAVIGTSSQKRREAVLKFRKDLAVKDIRGDIDERLAQLDRGEYDAVIVAHAAMIRLGYEARIAEIISLDIVQPHPLQGKLAVQVRRDRRDLIELFGRIDGN